MKNFISEHRKQVELEKAFYQNKSEARLAPLPLPPVQKDLSFGGTGTLLAPFDQRPGVVNSITRSVTKPDMFLAACYERYDPQNPEYTYLARVFRFDAAGQVDKSFGGSGEGFANVQFHEMTVFNTEGIHETSEGNIFVWGTAANFENTPFFVPFPVMVKLLPNGTFDSSFGINGVVDVRTIFPELPGITMVGRCMFTKDGSILLALQYGSGRLLACVIKLTPMGARDHSFQNDGVLEIQIPDAVVFTNGLFSRPEGQGYINCGALVKENPFNEGFLTGLTAEGNPDLSFGENGYAIVSLDGHDIELDGLSSKSANSTLLATGYAGHYPGDIAYYKSVIASLGNEGQVDPDFNAGDPVVHHFTPDPYWDRWTSSYSLENSDGKILVIGYSSNRRTNVWGAVIGSFNADGSLDETFVDNQPFGTIPDLDTLINDANSFLSGPSQILVGGYSVLGGPQYGFPMIAAIKI